MSFPLANLDLHLLQEAAEGACKQAILQVEEYLSLSLPNSSISFDLRGKSAGQYRFKPSGKLRFTHRGDHQLRFNNEVLEKYPKVLFEEVIPHEVAHFGAYTAFGLRIKPHGNEWKMLMTNVFKLEPSVTHNLELGNQKTQNKYTYYCACPGEQAIHLLSATRHNRIQKKSYRYQCRRCGEYLSLTHEGLKL